jgi:hypothetical protein
VRTYRPKSLLVLMIVAMTPQLALADDSLKTSNAIWKAIDNCNRAATRTYPDYTRESLAKREAFRRDCLRRGNLPATTDPTPPPPR